MTATELTEGFLRHFWEVDRADTRILALDGKLRLREMTCHLAKRWCGQGMRTPLFAQCLSYYGG